MNVASYIDHTLLKPEATKNEIEKLCLEAKEHHFKTVCIQPFWVKDAAEFLKDTDVGVTTVIGFPLGANATEIKVAEANLAIEQGASDIDMVINIGALKDHDDQTVLQDIQAVVDAVGERGIVKVIIETSLLTDDEKVRVSKMVKEAGADFVKTSTGFSTGGATLEDVRLLRETVGSEIGVKASGGVRSYEDALAMIEAGATRLGTSSGIKIAEGGKDVAGY